LSSMGMVSASRALRHPCMSLFFICSFAFGVQ
jgi:hypothetical protein